MAAPFDLTSTLGISQFYKDVPHFVSCTKSTFLLPVLYIASKDWGLFAELINPPRRLQPAICIK